MFIDNFKPVLNRYPGFARHVHLAANIGGGNDVGLFV